MAAPQKLASTMSEETIAQEYKALQEFAEKYINMYIIPPSNIVYRLDFKDNPKVKDEPYRNAKLAALLQRCPELSYFCPNIYLKYFNFREIAAYFPKNITVFDFCNCNLDDKYVSEIIKSIKSNNIKMSYLSFSFNNITDEIVDTSLVDSLSTGITSLNLSNTQLTKRGIERLFASIHKYPTINRIDLEGIDTGSSWSTYLKDIRTSCLDIYTSSEKLSDNDALILSTNVLYTSNIELHIKKNSFTKRGFKYLALSWAINYIMLDLNYLVEFKIVGDREDEDSKVGSMISCDDTKHAAMLSDLMEEYYDIILSMLPRVSNCVLQNRRMAVLTQSLRATATHKLRYSILPLLHSKGEIMDLLHKLELKPLPETGKDAEAEKHNLAIFRYQLEVVYDYLVRKIQKEFETEEKAICELSTATTTHTPSSSSSSTSLSATSASQATAAATTAQSAVASSETIPSYNR